MSPICSLIECLAVIFSFLFASTVLSIFSIFLVVDGIAMDGF